MEYYDGGITALPELRLFDTSDLPLQKGDFALLHSTMVRTRQFAEIAGLMDGGQSDQPMLKRFSRYNQSMHCRPIPPTTTCIFDPTSSSGASISSASILSAPIGLDSISTTTSVASSSHSRHFPRGGKLKTGLFSGNWTLRDKKEMRPSVHNITVVPIGRQAPSCSQLSSGPSSSSLQISVAARCPSSIEEHSFSGTNVPFGDRTSPLKRREPITCSRRSTLPQLCCENSSRMSMTPDLERKELRSRNNANECFMDRERQRSIEILQDNANGVTEDQGTIKSRKARLDNDTRDLNIDSSVSGNGNRMNGVSDNFNLARISKLTREEQESEIFNDFDDYEVMSLRDGNFNKEETRCNLMRRIGGVKSMGPIRYQKHKPIVQIFPETIVKSPHKAGNFLKRSSDNQSSNYSSSPDERSPTPPLLNNFTTHLVIDADSAYRTGTSDSSPSSVSSNVGGQSPLMRKNSVDLPDVGDVLPRNFGAHHVSQRSRKNREKKRSQQWIKKPIHEWDQGDLLLFLQKCELDDVASVMIGYDITGTDIVKWDNETLVQLGIENEESRRTLLEELNALKEQQQEKDSTLMATEKQSDKVKGRVPLFKLVRSASYDKVLAVETCLTTRDITVAEGRFGCLQVTKVNGANIPLKEQDCFLEVNDKPGQLFRSPLMFTKLISDVAGEPIRLVVLRRRMFTVDGEDEVNSMIRERYLAGSSQMLEQDSSSASSGVSSSEISSDTALLQHFEEKKSEVLRF